MKLQKGIIKKSLCMFLMIGLVLAFSFGSYVDANNSNNQNNLFKIESVEDLTGIINEHLLEQAALTNTDYNKIDKNQEIWTIVQMKDSSLLERYLTGNSQMDFPEYLNNDVMIDYTNRLLDKQANLIANINAKLNAEIKYNYTTLINGLAVKIKYKDLATLKSLSGVEEVIISQTFKPAETTSVNDTEVVENVVNVYETGIYNSSSVEFNGEGTVVAVIDTGLDYYHSAFQKQPVGKVSITKDILNSYIENSEAYRLSAENDEIINADDVYISGKVPFAYDYADKDADVYPISDHGTHVAGIIAGQDEQITGVATEAQLAIMKVFSNADEGAATIDILAALSDCVLLNVDVINMSLGSACGFARDSDDEAINSTYDLVKDAGIALITAASNSYSSAMSSTYGNYNLTDNPDSGTVGSPASYPASLAVASISGVKTGYIIANNATTVYFKESSLTGQEHNNFVSEILDGKSTASFEYVTIPGNGASSDYIGIEVSGKIALVRRGVSSFEDKVKTAAAYGAKGVIIYNNVSGSISMSVGSKYTIPSCSISMDIGGVLSRQASGTIEVSTEYLAGPFMSDFSSWGVLPNLELKPDITAHGGEIYSAVRGGYDRLSGTSMAAPNMAGAALLVREYVKQMFPNYSAIEVTNLVYQLMMSTATIAYNEYGNPYSPRKQGAGLADILNATTTEAYLWVDGDNKTKITYGDDPSKTGVYELEFNLTNLSNSTKSFNVDPKVMTESLSSDGKTVSETAYMFNSNFKVKVNNGSLYDKSTVVVGGYQTAKITVEITLSEDEKKYLDDNFANGMYVEGFIQLLSQDSNCDLSIPWLAFYGDWSQPPMLDVTEYQVGDDKLDSSILEKDKTVAALYATAPMGAFKVSPTSETISVWGLGMYGYLIENEDDKPASQEDKASLTTNPNGTYSLQSIYAGLLRGAKTVDMVIKDKMTGKVVYTNTVYDVAKSSYDGGRRPGYIPVEFSAIDLNLSNNKQYTFEMVCTPDWDENKNYTNNLFTFDFYIDSEAPVLLENQCAVRIEEDSDGNVSYYLDMYVYDNHYIQCYTIATYDSIVNGEMIGLEKFSEYPIPVDSARNETNRITYDLTYYWNDIIKNGDKLYLEFTDYAKNKSTYSITLPRVFAETIEFSQTDFSLNINQTINVYRYLTLTPDDSWKDNLTWTSSDESIVRAHKGDIMGVSAGNAVVTVTSNTGAVAKLNITVSERDAGPITLRDLILNKETLTLSQGEEYTLVVSIDPWNISDSNVDVSWRTTNSKIVSITENPDNQYEITIKAVAEGSASIIVQSGPIITSRCQVTVEPEYEVESVYLKSYNGRGDENGVVEIPDDLGITMIYQAAFYFNEYVKKVIIPEGVESIGYAAFYGMDQLEEVVLPSTVKTIEEWAFGWNPKLKIINLENVVTIGNLSFYNSPMIQNVDLSNTYFIGDRAFYGNEYLTTIDIRNAGYVGYAAFAYNSSLTTINMSEKTGLGLQSFAGCRSLVEVSIPTDHVGVYSFANCSSLRSVTFTNDVNIIGFGAFYNCTGLENVSYLGTVYEIGPSAFAACSKLKSVTIPNGLEILDTTAYANCSNVTRVLVSADARIKSIARGVFGGCAKLISFEVEDGNKYFSSHSGILYDKSGTELLIVPAGLSMETFNVPTRVKKIADYAFSHNSNLRIISLNNVEIIGEGAFYYCNKLTTINYGTSLKEVGAMAFYYCQSLKVYIPDSVEYIGADAYQYCRYNTEDYEIIIPESVSYLGERAFANLEGVTKVTINANIDYLPDSLFANTNDTNKNILTDVVINSDIRTFGAYVFKDCLLLENITIPANLEKISEGTFYGCESITSVELPDAVTEIPAYAYMYCKSLTDITIPNGVTLIGQGAFFECRYLTAVDFNNTKELGVQAFYLCNLEKVESDVLEVIGINCFMSMKTLNVVNIPNVITIMDGAFQACSGLTSENLTITNVISIGTAAFSRCNCLAEITLPKVENISKNAFYASALTTITMPNVKSIGTGAFSLTNIEEINLPESVIEVAYGAFDNMGVLKTINVVESNPNFFSDEGVLYEILPNGQYELNSYPFAKEGQEYHVLEEAISIKDNAFLGNTRLKKIVLPTTLLAIGNQAFYKTSITTYDFRCVIAPILESSYDATKAITYNNFVEYFTANNTLGLEIIYPTNGVGYSSYIWDNYFNTSSQGEIQPDENVINFIRLMKLIPDVITLADKDMVNEAAGWRVALTNKMLEFVDEQYLEKYEKVAKQLAELEKDDDPVVPVDPVVPTKPKDKNVLPWILIIGGVIIAGAGAAVLIIMKKKH